ncbi:MAG: hypothetical protein ACLU4N_13900 [Butyricimonas faecihominis]
MEFGITASIGITFVYLVCLVMIPCGFSFMPEPDSKQIKHLHNKTVTGTLERVIQLILNRRNVVYGVAISVVILGIIGLTS